MNVIATSPLFCSRWSRGLLAAFAALLMAGCAAPLLLSGAAMGGAAMVATDRRTTATQLEDQSIELKAGNRVRDIIGDKHRVNVSSYNRLVLLTGEIPVGADKAAIDQAVAKVDNVKNVVDELQPVPWPSTLSERSGDTALKVKVSATLIDAKGLSSNAFNITVERGVVYLQGRVTEAEATRAVDLIRTIKGVQKVVRVLEIISEEELAALKAK